MALPRNVRGGYKVAGLGSYGKSPPRHRKSYDGRVYADAQPWHPSSPRVRVRRAILVTRAFLTALHGLGGHPDRPYQPSVSGLPPCLICNPGWQ